MSVSKFLLKSVLKRPRRSKRARGFTLLELLVGLVLTFLIITPLMSLVISLMNTDRQEQAKNSSQQEIQAALDYMAQDLQQAIYIYDATALSRGTNSSDPALSGILDQIPPRSQAPGCTNQAECVPVLAFWKRKYFDRNDTVKDPVTGTNVNIKEIQDISEGSDRFVYSLVVYYLIKDSSQTWSQTARVGRFEIHDGIPRPVTGSSTPNYFLNPDQGFKGFDLSISPTSVQQSMNSWTKKGTGNYTQQVETLVDYIDDTPLANIPASLRNQLRPPINTPDDDGLLASNVCEDRLVSSPTGGSSTPLPPASRIPPDQIITNNLLNTGSFYACVKPINAQGQSVAQIYLRGNALPRLNKNPQTWDINGANQEPQLNYRPIANVRIAVRGLLGGDSK